MAKILYGESVAQMSGSVGGTVHSRNRYGAYTRQRVHPTVATSDAANMAKTILSGVSAAWDKLTSDERVAWASYAANNPIMDRVGMKQVLDGHAMFVRNTIRIRSAGGTPTGSPPIGVTPGEVDTISVSGHETGQVASVAFTNSPLNADECLEVWGCVCQRVGQNYVKNKMRMLQTSDPAATSPFGVSTTWTARLGALVTGQIMKVQGRVINQVTGLVSRFMDATATVTMT